LELLDGHIKNENEILKANLSQLQRDKEQLKSQKKFLVRRAKKWYVQRKKGGIRIRRLRTNLNEARRQIQTPSSWLNILIHASKRAQEERIQQF
jgi:hypothetical protein